MVFQWTWTDKYVYVCLVLSSSLSLSHTSTSSSDIIRRMCLLTAYWKKPAVEVSRPPRTHTHTHTQKHTQTDTHTHTSPLGIGAWIIRLECTSISKRQSMAAKCSYHSHRQGQNVRSSKNPTGKMKLHLTRLPRIQVFVSVSVCLSVCGGCFYIWTWECHGCVCFVHL